MSNQNASDGGGGEDKSPNTSQEADQATLNAWKYHCKNDQLFHNCKGTTTIYQ